MESKYRMDEKNLEKLMFFSFLNGMLTVITMVLIMFMFIQSIYWFLAVLINIAFIYLLNKKFLFPVLDWVWGFKIQKNINNKKQ